MEDIRQASKPIQLSFSFVKGLSARAPVNSSMVRLSFAQAVSQQSPRIGPPP